MLIILEVLEESQVRTRGARFPSADRRGCDSSGMTQIAPLSLAFKLQLQVNVGCLRRRETGSDGLRGSHVALGVQMLMMTWL